MRLRIGSSSIIVLIKLAFSNETTAFSFTSISVRGVDQDQWCSAIKITRESLAQHATENNSKSRNLPIFGINKGAQPPEPP